MYKDYSIDKFVCDLSSDLPAPGGGGAAALAASIGSALGAMVYSLTVDKKMYNSYDEAARKLIDDNLRSLMTIKDEFLEFMDKDAEAFLSLMDSFKLPKASEEEKKIRHKKLQEGYIDALSTPLNLAQKAFETYEFILNACKYGNKGVISDAGVAAIMLQAAIDASVLNVRVNLAYVEDSDRVADIKALCEDLVDKGIKKRSEILNLVYAEIEK